MKGKRYIVLCILLIATILITTTVSASENVNVSYYNFSTGSGTVIYDVWNSNNMEFVSNADWVAAYPTYNTSGDGSGYALDTSESLGTARIQDATFPEIQEQNWSASGWFYRNDGSDAYDLIGRFTIGTETTNSMGFGIVAQEFIISLETAGIKDEISTVGTFTNTSQWTHFAISVNSTDPSKWRVYINGVNQSFVVDYSGSVSNIVFDRLTIGSNHNSYAGQFDGYLDEIKIKEGGITQEEVLNDYNIGKWRLSGGGSPPAANGTQYLNVTANNNYGNTINSFTVNINGTDYTTTNGTANTNLNITDPTTLSALYTIIVKPTGYYNLTYSNVNISNAAFVSNGSFQSEITFQAYEYITNTQLNNYTVNDSTLTDTTTTGAAKIRLLAGDNQVITITSPNGYYNKTFNVNVTALDNNTRNTTLYNAILNVDPRDYFTNATISNFTVNITLASPAFNAFYTTTGNNISINLTRGYNYTVVTNPSDYAANTTNISIVDISKTLYIYGFRENSVYIRVYDEERDTLITWRNVSIEFIGDNLSTSNTTDTGALIVYPLIAGDYRLRYSATSYPERLYFATVTDGDTQTIDVYLLNESQATNITANVYDLTDTPVENAYVQLLRYYVADNVYKTVEIGQTNYEGQTGLTVAYNDEFYKFIIEYQNTNYLQTQPLKITSTELNFYIDLGVVNPTVNLEKIINLAYNLQFNNDTNTFSYTFADTNGAVTQGCLYVYTVGVSRETLYNSTCVNSSGASILIGITEVNGTTYKAKAYNDFNDGRGLVFVDQLIHSFVAGKEIFGNVGLFLMIFMIIAFSFIALWNPNVSIIMVLVSLVFGNAIGFINIGATAILTMVAAGFIIIIIQRRTS